MKRVMIILILGLNLLLSAKIDCPKASKFIDAKLGYYVFRREQFVRDNRCVISSDSIFLNKQTNKIRKLSGFVTGLSMYGNILQVNIVSGAHTNKVYFYSIDENGTLHDIKGGIMSSDGEDPIVNKDPYDSNIIKVYTTNWWDKKIDDKTSCRITTLDMYRYEDGIFKHIIKDKEIYESCRSEK